LLTELFTAHQFWVGLPLIIGTNLVLSGDNAVVIALAASSLPRHQQGKAIMWGSLAAAVLLIILTIVAVTILQWPFLKVIGGLMLLWVGVQLVAGEDEEEGDVTGHSHLIHAIRTILVANLVMSLDNTLAVAGIAEQVASGIDPAIRKTGQYIMLSIGLGVSIPVVVFGSKVVMWFIQRFPIIILLGGALIGYIGGDMLVTDPFTRDWVAANAPWLHQYHGAGIIGAVIAIGGGKWLAFRAAGRQSVAGSQTTSST